MKIEGMGLPTQPRPVSEPVVGVSRSAATVPEPTAGDSVSRIAAALREMGADISEARLAALAAELETIGVSLARLDAGTALRALFLSANGVALAPELLQAGASPDVMARGLAELADAARTLLMDAALPADVRTALTVFLHDAEVWVGARNDFAQLVETSATGGFPVNLAGGADEAAATTTAGLTTGGTVAENLRALLRNGGSSFEWRLLAWHRAGADPAGLASLAGSDLKGMLLRLLAALESLKRKDAESAVSKLGEQARSLVDRATAWQVSAILDNTGGHGSAAFEVPFPAFGGGTAAEVRADGGGVSGGDSSGPGGFTFAFSVETANLGPVRAHVRTAGGMLSAVFVLMDERAKTVADGMAGEFRDMLTARGFTPVMVRFAVEGTDDALDVPAPQLSHPLDVRG